MTILSQLLSTVRGWMTACFDEDGKEKIIKRIWAGEYKKKEKRFLTGGMRGRLGSHSAAPGKQINTLRTCGPVMVTMETAVETSVLFSPSRLLFIMLPLHCSHSGGSWVRESVKRNMKCVLQWLDDSALYYTVSLWIITLIFTISSCFSFTLLFASQPWKLTYY